MPKPKPTSVKQTERERQEKSQEITKAMTIYICRKQRTRKFKGGESDMPVPGTPTQVLRSASLVLFCQQTTHPLENHLEGDPSRSEHRYQPSGSEPLSSIRPQRDDNDTHQVLFN